MNFSNGGFWSEEILDKVKEQVGQKKRVWGVLTKEMKEQLSKNHTMETELSNICLSSCAFGWKQLQCFREHLTRPKAGDRSLSKLLDIEQDRQWKATA